jgi:hypothetical protein
MGWGSGTNAAGREVGYAIDATCDEPDCTVEIDRGLAYVCGGMHDGAEHGCGGYFCSDHRFVACPPPGGRAVFLCARCAAEAGDFEDEVPS